MKYFIVMAMLMASVLGMSQVVIPDLSPRSTLTQRIGLTELTLSYSKPSLRGRTLLGEEGILVQDELWRTGANAVTSLTTSEEITIKNQSLDKGKYAILSKPGKQTWTFFFYPYNSSAWTSYQEATPILQFMSDVESRTEKTESLLFYFDQLDLEKGVLNMAWENIHVSTSITIDESEKVKKGMERALKGPSNFDYFRAALYLHEAQTDLEQALVYVKSAIEATTNVPAFMHYRQALILKDLGRLKQAREVAKIAMLKAEETGNKEIVRLSRRIAE